MPFPQLLLAVSFWNTLTLWPLPVLSCSRHQPSGSGSPFWMHCFESWKSIPVSGHHCDGIIWTMGHRVSHCFIILCCSFAGPISLSDLVFLVLTITEPWPEDKYVLGFCFSGREKKKKVVLIDYCFSRSRSSCATYQMVSVEAAILPV